MPGITQTPAHFHAVHFWQHQIQHDAVVVVGGGQAVGNLAVTGVIDGHVGAFQVAADGDGEILVIFDQQNVNAVGFAYCFCVHNVSSRPS